MRKEASLPSGRKTLALDERGELWISRTYGTRQVSVSRASEAKDRSGEESGSVYDPVRFNEQYADYYPPCIFTAIAGTKKGFAAAGVDDRGRMVLYRSMLGGVWEQIPLVCRGDVLTGRVAQILVSEKPEQLILCCENGSLVTVPDCIRCIKVRHVTDRKITGAAFDGDGILLLAEGGDRIRFSLREASQVRMHPEKVLSEDTGKEKFAYLGNFPDSPFVREWGRKCLARAVYLQEDQLEDYLAGQDPAEKVFFFCDYGVRSDQAAWDARRLGHYNAYSLGGICMPDL